MVDFFYHAIMLVLLVFYKLAVSWEFSECLSLFKVIFS